MKTPAPKWRRRKEARPSDIVAAALHVFGEKGFAGARIEEIAARAGVSKGTLYLYFETKSDIFRAVVRQAVTPNIEAFERSAAALDVPFAALIRILLPRIAELIATAQIGRVVKMVVGESRNFPELARVWHDDVVLKGVTLIAGLVERAQRKGEVRPGDPRTPRLLDHGPDAARRALAGDVHAGRRRRNRHCRPRPPACRNDFERTARGGERTMKRQRLVILVLAGLALFFLAWRLLAPQFRPAPTLSGYIEGETLYLAAAVVGPGDRSRRPPRPAGRRRHAACSWSSPTSRSPKASRPPPSLPPPRAQAEDARHGPASRRSSRSSKPIATPPRRRRARRGSRWAAPTQLVRRGIYARVRLDEARAAWQSAAARVDAARRRIDVANLGQRERSDPGRRRPGRAGRAPGYRKPAPGFATLSPIAPSAGRIEEVFYQRGEWAAANQPSSP